MGIDSFFSLYGAIALTHLFNQINLAHIHHVRHKEKEPYDEDYVPSVAIIIPSYNENYEDLYKCVKSCINQDYPDPKIILVDDGSKDMSAFDRVVQDFSNNKNFYYVAFQKNKGKRHAQKEGFDFFSEKVDIMVTIDSDTFLYKDTLKKLVQKFKDSKVGAVTGDVRARRTKKLLSKLIYCRYWTAFNQERAAQGLFGHVLCCSGPLAAYRTSVIEKIKNKYINQKFFGQKCTYGDDRHLTNLVLEQGYKVKYEPRALAVTGVPENMKSYLKQQTRWNKSFYRELLWTLKIYFKNPKKFHPYIIYDLFVQLFLPFMLMLSLGYSIFKAFTGAPIFLLGYILIIAGIAFIRMIYGYFRIKDKSLFLFPMYAFIHIFLLIPVRLYALATLRTTHWGTR